ncbi:hypothetical protein BOQ62_19405 [Chryseobacterium sp. CH21]|nr:hypothetical protein BOQ62_19405 [Chryseobacterium sp. CH21]
MFSAIVAGQQTKPSNAKTEDSFSKKQTIERKQTLQNDSIAKGNVNNALKKSLNNDSYFKKYENNSKVQNNVNQLNRNNTMFNNTTNGSYISPNGKVVNPMWQQGPGTMQVQVPLFKSK